ncbi:putative bifunctional P-450:NADPH-P450 reductase [Cryphonectria parasitica EP155]|uniref:Bifunctional cytochrome P450/NADPH--P450 reductase n=1 Tax=Cryphonectria parasitica (strain ATCC 38755 / EP155) TaxID=660469 RepID=A0A9P4Y2J1_CRYP1|nr:putative bifunctional P-450:NADPH-P450 reductase [Cryphonectria parasitica EP155]KAF3765308.1 putative bifunctional P-450:NADPH-P450 reductase [Cryphonectria parasitica EP155]
MTNTIPIPEPPGWPILGNLLDLDFQLPLRSLCELAEKHGELYRMRLPGQTILIASSHDLVNELCDEKRFPKTIQGLREMRHGVHDGLLTAQTEEPNWGIAHRVLMPAFGPSSLPVWFDGMFDIASQLALKWARHGKDNPITVTEDFTRLTLDTIALCSMDFRFNSFYKENLHPFIKAMCDFLVETGNRASRMPLPSMFYKRKDRKFFSDIEVLRKTADEVLQARRSEGGLDTRKDLLSVMLNGVDSKTGQRVSDQSILDNLITFLIAGHETTSGLLSFTFYHLITNPKAYQKAQEEVDSVCGQGPIKFEHLSKLSYISAVLREALRLNPTIPVFNVAAKKDEIVGGRYHIPAKELILLLLTRSHLDPKVYGEDAMEFNPDRMFDENFDHLNKEFPNCWKPFGNGARACIGRPFAWQEATLVVAMLLQNFNFTLDDPNYSLSLKQTLTVKPDGLQIRAALRNGLTATQLERNLAGTAAPLDSKSAALKDGLPRTTNITEKATHMSIYYGSNSGTCQSIAETLAANAFSRGFHARVVDIADSATGKLPPNEPVVIITASYEGQPPDNAARFVGWLETTEDGDLTNVSYAVFGCGHRDWASTFHRVPKLVDAAMEKLGACRIAPLGLSDVAGGTMFTDFETWEDDVFWPAMIAKYGAAVPEEPTLAVEVSSPRKSILHYQDVREASVVATSVLTADNASVKKRNMVIQLPLDTAYRAGDYLAVLPVNPRENVYRVLRHFRLPWDAHLKISANTLTPLPGDVAVPAAEVFGSYVELSQPATKRNILTLADFARDECTKANIQALATDDCYTSKVVAKRISVLDLLETNTNVHLSLSSFLRMLPPMRVRQYSISSSPLSKGDHAVLTYSVLDEPTGHVGVATSYLSSLQEGDMMHVTVRPSHAAFHLPKENDRSMPIIMVAAGTGIAPFRGFIEERAALQKAGKEKTLAPAVLFFGCRDATKDDLYRAEFDAWEASGAVSSVHRAYSRRAEESDGCRHVQDRLWKERQQVMCLWEKGAKLYICGGRAVGEGVKNMFINIYVDAAKKEGQDISWDSAKEWFEGLKNDRWAMDVFN